MRRYTVNERNDVYGSKRDYQTTIDKNSQGLLLDDCSIVFKNFIDSVQTKFTVGFGGFIYPENSTEMKVTMSVIDVRSEMRKFNLKNGWNRVGFCFDLIGPFSGDVVIEIEFTSSRKVSMWGIEIDILSTPDNILSQLDDTSMLNQRHLSPETYYFPHDTSLNVDIDEEQKYKFSLIEGEFITLKKCCYCQRLLPLQMDVLGSLSFHKHNAKISKHQNECRSCKKWRINDTLNPYRTTDQLHESSVITRERKILLREPQILQEIKQRTGAGLKSLIWEKFGRKCFYCGTPVKLDEFQLDHTRPLAYLWPIDEYATCLCPEHNNQKKDKFPVDFYSESQLSYLSEITGLPYDLLCAKEVNQTQLDIIISDICGFAIAWDSRTFNAIARKVNEIRGDTDLFAILKERDEELHDALVKDLSSRPPVED